MATNDYGSTPPNAGNDAPADEEYGAAGGQGGESVPCLHIYAMTDGSFKVEQSEGAPPEQAQAVPDLDTVMQLVQSAFGGGSGGEQDEDQALASAQKGYGKPKEMQAPNPGGLFGE